MDNKRLSGSRRSRGLSFRRRQRRLGFEALEQKRLMSTDVWTGTVNSNWSNPGNWSLNQVPGSTDTAEFQNGRNTATVDTIFTIDALQIDSSWGGTLTVSNPLTVSDNLTLASGTLSLGAAMSIGGSGSEWTDGGISLNDNRLTNTGTLSLANAGTFHLLGPGTLANSGTIDDQLVGGLATDDGVTLDNQLGGTFDFQVDSSTFTDLGHSVGRITNEGTIEKTVTTGTTTINSAFDNSGTINVQTGTISLDSAGGTNTGGSPLPVASGKPTPDLTGGATVDDIGSFTGSGAGTISLQGGTLAIGSGGATFNFPGPRFQWTGGIINTVSGNLNNTQAQSTSLAPTARSRCETWRHPHQRRHDQPDRGGQLYHRRWLDPG